ncbi:MAG: hypothetical protein NXH90_05145 [Flavobacteriaceae bacterium]|nr:hypothetical protein [Flavobacteriaceae bacterium]
MNKKEIVESLEKYGLGEHHHYSFNMDENDNIVGFFLFDSEYPELPDFQNDISFLYQLPNLEHIEICIPQSLDIEPISALSHLKSILIEANEIFNLEKLIGLEELTTLSIDGSSTVQELSFLRKSKKLGKLCLWTGNINDITAISELTLLHHLNLNANKIEDISAIRHCRHIKNLSLVANPIKNLGYVAELTSLETLSLSNLTKPDISFLENLTSLSSLNFTDSQIDSIDSLKNLKQLTGLNLSYNNIIDIEPISHITGIHFLNLSNNRIEKIEHLRYLVKLEHLNLSHNNIFEIMCLENMTFLKELYMEENQVVSISPFNELNSLIRVNFSHNKITDINNLPVNAMFVNLDNNPIKTITLDRKNSIKSLSLKNNEIIDFSSLQEIDTVSSLDLRREEHVDSDFSFLFEKNGYGDNKTRKNLNTFLVLLGDIFYERKEYEKAFRFYRNGNAPNNLFRFKELLMKIDALGEIKDEKNTFKAIRSCIYDYWYLKKRSFFMHEKAYNSIQKAIAELIKNDIYKDALFDELDFDPSLIDWEKRKKINQNQKNTSNIVILFLSIILILAFTILLYHIVTMF